MENVGSYVPAPDIKRRADKSDPENVRYLESRLYFLLNRGGGRKGYTDFVADIENFQLEINKKNKDLSVEILKHKITYDKIRQFSQGRIDQISKNDFRLIVYFLDFRGVFRERYVGNKISEKYEDPLFHSLMDFMGVGDFTYTNIRRHAPGLYTAYRPSSTFPGCFWVGAMEISVNEQSGAIQTFEFYQSSGFDSRPNKIVTFTGYLIRKGRHYTILSRNHSSSSLCATLLPSVTVEGHKITNMTGATLDMSTGRLWSGRILFDRFNLDSSTSSIVKSKQSYKEIRNAFFESACVLKSSEIPESIAFHFSELSVPNLKLF